MESDGLVSSGREKSPSAASGNRINDVVKEVFYRVYYQFDT
jgi:hypothetical protein